MTDHFGLVVVSAKKFSPLPLKDVNVEAEVHGYVLGLKSTLKYENTSTDPVEVLFRFPLEQSHAVVSLTAVIDGRRIRAEIKDKLEAKAEYEDAIASGQTAAFGEEKAGDIFSISLGNLPPNKEAEIVLHLVGELPIDAEGSIRFSLPATLKPRYVPANSSDPLEKVEGESDQVMEASTSSVQKFRLSILNQRDVAEVTSPTHAITVNKDADIVDVTLADITQSLSSDLVILVRYDKPHSPKVLVEKRQEDAKEFMKHTGLMVNFFPEFPSESNTQYEFIFLVDRSGSMRGSYITSARETLLLFLKSLPEDCHFNIVGFGSRYTKLFQSGSVQYSQKSLDKATQHAKGMQADLGGTELLPPLKDILSAKPPLGLARLVFVLTDGAVSNTSACVDIVKQNVIGSRCFTFGIGSGASSALVEGLARAGNGSAEFIKGSERMQPKVIRSLKRATQPCATNVSVEFDLGSPDTTVAYQSPDKLPPIYNREKLVVYGLIKHPARSVIQGNVILSGKILGDSFRHQIPFVSHLKSSGQSDIFPVHRLAAKALIIDWQDDGKSKESIISLSVESSVVSKYTAFIAVDEENSTPVEGALKTWDIMSQGYLEYHQMAPGAAPPPTLQACSFSSSAPKKRSGFSFPGFGGGGGGGRALKKKSAASNKRGIASGASSTVPTIVDMECALERCSSVIDEDEEEGARALPPPSLSRRSMASSGSTDILSSLIASQQANGSWKLDSSIAKILSMTLKEVEDACPQALREISVWVTILVLTVLEKKCSSQKDEWELLDLKARSWLKKQSLPSEMKVSDVFTAAGQVVQ